MSQANSSPTGPGPRVSNISKILPRQKQGRAYRDDRDAGEFEPGSGGIRPHNGLREGFYRQVSEG